MKDATNKMSTESSNPKSGPRKFEFPKSIGPVFALICVVLFFAVLDNLFSDGKFLTVQNFRTVTIQTCVVAVAALGMTVIVISGGIDLSSGTALALSATTLAWGINADVGFMFQNGDSFQGISRKVAKDQEELRKASRKGDDDAMKETTEQLAGHQEKLLVIAQLKLERAKHLLSTEISPSELEVANELAEEAQKKYEQASESYKPSLKSTYRKLSSSASAKERRFKKLQTNVDKLEKRIVAIQEDDFHLTLDDVEQSWSDGIPNHPWSAPLAIVIGICTGLACGLINGILISTLKIVPFVVTLGTMTIFLGVGNFLSNHNPIRPAIGDQSPAWLQDVLNKSSDSLILGMPLGVWILVVLSIVLMLLLKYTVFGRYIFALGSNESTARLCGIHVIRYKIALYAMGGLLIGVAGLLQFSRLSIGSPDAGVGLELQIIAAVVIGGGSLSGGRGSVIGTLCGAAILLTLINGCTQLGLPNSIEKIVIGMIIIGAVGLDQFRGKLANPLQRKKRAEPT